MRLRCWFCWFSLVLVVSGTPARQIEAASDLARTMAELDDDDRRIEEVDGGVGDDSLEATKADPHDLGVALAAPDSNPASCWFIANPVSRSAERPFASSVGCRPPDRSSRRQARLGCFLF